MSDPRPDAGPPAAATRPRRPWTVVVAGALGLAASAGWLVGTYFFWYYEPAAPAAGSLLFALLIVVTWWTGDRVVRILTTIVGLGEAIFYGPGGLIADALVAGSLILLYLPRTNAWVRRPTPVPPPQQRR